ncbi:membrane protein [Streptococcus himalayensis]|uniref:Membrane protein n=2 Tax=Streptococcus himalayensis TaxID=1888195 RepID=A0A917EDX1_9STRE|nr:membrane protein [Streptococcus himalayensis]
MVGVMLHWLLVAIYELPKMSTYWLVLLALPAYFYRQKLASLYRYLMKHKGAVMVAVILFQLAMLLSAELLIRRDAAVVFKGAFRFISDQSISNYLTRNPNNLALFLYERWFYALFGDAALWILQALNMLYTDLTAVILYKGMKRYKSQASADAVYSLYLALLGFSPYFYSMYTDIWPLPLIAGQIFLIFALLEKYQERSKTRNLSLVLGVVSAIAYVIRPTTMILLMAYFILLFFKGNWKKALLILGCFSLAFAPVYAAQSYLKNTQQEVQILEGDGLAKGPLLFINLGLTFIGHDQEDMKEGLLQYIEPSERENYNNGMFATENVKKEIKRRLEDYSVPSFLSHLSYKHSLTVAEGTLGWLYRAADKEKTPYISPLYEHTKHQSFARFIRTYFLDIDKQEYDYYKLIKQLVWIVMSLGLVFATLKYHGSDQLNFLLLAVFGGLLFLLIFEGGKTRYLIQFLPQILLLASLGLTELRPTLGPRKERK